MNVVETCANCATRLPADARFCMSCGQPATAAPSDEPRLTRLQAAAPHPLVHKMKAPRVSGERKPVTAVFADVVGSTSLAESMDAEDWTGIMNGAFELMSEAIYRYEGTIAKLVGDAVLAFFGAPVAHEDDPERAVRAALDMLASIGGYRDELRATYGIDFGLRIGINTGPVLVGNVGSDLRYEYTALGDAMNVAARMQTAADPGSVLITAGTYHLVRGLVDVRDVGPLEVKGKADPVQAYEVIGLKTERVSSRGVVGLESPMVGRAGALGELTAALEAVRAGRGRAVVVVGEPGIGKSRLLTELRLRALEDPGVTWVQGHCVSFGRSLPYHLFVDVVRSLVGVGPLADDAETQRALRDRIDSLLDEGRDEAYALLGHLVGVPLEPAVREQAEQLEPQTLQAAYLKWLGRVFAALTRDGAVVLVCEDIHWADPTSVEVLGKLLALVNEMPILLVLASRPDRDAAGWRLVTQARDLFGETMTEIRLAPLSEDDSRELVANLLAIESLPMSTRDFILARAEGNPFFVEEVIRMLIERGAIIRQDDAWIATGDIEGVEIPDTIHGLLLARIDRLPEEAKRTLRVASVIGRQFSVRVLESVLDDRGAP
ncbi:MAG: AAA family ATPase [Chloroflexi bacterium]|nr:AAA family ATPase [Chloroflexota bacterium]